jgi:hypothetical protein
MTQTPHLIFIHGLSNKPSLNDLKRIWLEALAEPRENNPGFDLSTVGVKSTFIYWANLFYDEPLAAENYESRSDELSKSVANEIELPSDAWVAAMLKQFPIDEDNVFEDAPTENVSDLEYERIPLPWVVKKQVIKHFLQEAHGYLFNIDGVRDVIRKKVVVAINQAKVSGERIVLVGHSQGAIIAYDVLSGDSSCPNVDGLMTLGSPLGIDEVQDKLTWSRNNGFPDKLKGSWINVYDSFDAVARLDPKHANDFKKNGKEVVIDIQENNWGSWRHSATKYLKGSALRKYLRELAGRS